MDPEELPEVRFKVETEKLLQASGGVAKSVRLKVDAE